MPESGILPHLQAHKLACSMSWMKKTRGSQVRLSTTSSRDIMFVSVPFVPGDPRGHYRWAGWLLNAQWVCVQPRNTELGNLLLYL